MLRSGSPRLVDWILGEFVGTEGQKTGGKYQVQGVFELVEFFSQIARLWKLCSFPFKGKDRWYPTIILEVAKLAAKTSGV